MKHLKTTDFLKGKSDSGAALALVLLLVVFLSLWLAAVTIFNGTSKDAAAHTIAKSQERQSSVNAAVDAALAAINAPGANYVPSAADTLNGAGGNCPSTMPDVSAATPVYTDANGIKVYCVLANSSSVVALPGGIVLTGTSVSAPSSTVGQGLGLSVISPSTVCDPTTGLVANTTIFFAASAVNSTNKCPIVQGQPSANNTGTAGTATIQVPPGAGNGGTNTFGGATVYNPATNSSGTGPVSTNAGLDPHTPGSSMYYYNKYETKNLPKAPVQGASNSKATIEGTCTAPVAFTVRGSSKSQNYVVVHASSNKTPTDSFKNSFEFGWIDDATLGTLNTMTGTSSSSCGSKGVPIIFAGSGTYKGKTDVHWDGAVFRFERNSATSQSTVWSINNHTEVSFGHPTSGSGNHINGCDTTQPGSMVEYGIGAKWTMDQSKLFLCDLTTTNAETTHQYPACAAPEQGYGADFYYSETDTNGQRRNNEYGNNALVYMNQPSASDESDAKSKVTSASYIWSRSNGSDKLGKWSEWSTTEKKDWVHRYAKNLHIEGKTETEQLANIEANAHGEQRKAEGTRRGGEDDRVSEGLSTFSVSGSCFAPAGWMHLYNSSFSKAHFSKGLMLRALELKVGDKSSSLTDYAPDREVGDRKVRLDVYMAGRLLTSMAVAIHDNFGYRGKSGDGYTIVGQSLNN